MAIISIVVYHEILISPALLHRRSCDQMEADHGDTGVS